MLSEDKVAVENRGLTPETLRNRLGSLLGAVFHLT